MSKADAIQTAINQTSLTLNVAEDVAKALKAAELHPVFAQVFMRMHHTQIEQDKEIKALRSSMLQLATVIAKGADVSAAALVAMDALAQRLGIDAQSLFGPEAVSSENATE